MSDLERLLPALLKQERSTRLRAEVDGLSRSLNAAIAELVRNATIEECAEVAEDFEKEGRIAAAIRALKDKP